MGKNNDSQVLRGLLDTLALISIKEQDNYGFGILQSIRSKLEGENDVLGESTLYPLLHRLENKNYVESYMKPGNRGTPRKYYRLTSTGEEYLAKRIQDWAQVQKILNDVVLGSENLRGNE